jgi:phage shock protein A
MPANDPSAMTKPVVEQLLRPLAERIQKLEQKVQEQDRRIAELIQQTLALMSR